MGDGCEGVRGEEVENSVGGISATLTFAPAPHTSRERMNKDAPGELSFTPFWPLRESVGCPSSLVEGGDGVGGGEDQFLSCLSYFPTLSPRLPLCSPALL